MVVDTVFEDGTNNQGLGKFVAIRVDSALLSTACERQDGWYYIGYAHLSSVSAPNATLNPPFPRVPSNLEVGMTGATGTNNVHLDLTVFWVPKQNALGAEPIPQSIGRLDPAIPAHENHQTFYSLATTTGFQAVIVDPVEVWNNLPQGTTCVITIICP
jgi:hypothetical protein